MNIKWTRGEYTGGIQRKKEKKIEFGEKGTNIKLYFFVVL